MKVKPNVQNEEVIIAEIPYRYDHLVKLDVKTMKFSFHFGECYKLELYIQNINDPPYKDQNNLNLALISEVQLNITYFAKNNEITFTFVSVKNIYFMKENPKIMYIKCYFIKCLLVIISRFFDASVFSNYNMNLVENEKLKYKMKISEFIIFFPNDFVRIGHFFSQLFSSLSLAFLTYSSNLKPEKVHIY